MTKWPLGKLEGAANVGGRVFQMLEEMYVYGQDQMGRGCHTGREALKVQMEKRDAEGRRGGPGSWSESSKG